MGLHTQEKWQDFRYASAQAVDCRSGRGARVPRSRCRHACLARHITGVRTFFELGSDAVLRAGPLHPAAGSRCDLDEVRDFGAGVAVLNVTVFASNFDGMQRAFVALSTGAASTRATARCGRRWRRSRR